MDRNAQYYKQVKLLIQMLPVVAKEDVFALKGGTAINLFVREFPRLSVVWERLSNRPTSRIDFF